MSTTFDQAQETSREVRFISALNGLDRAERARLRRNAGNSLGEARDVLVLFYRILPPDVPMRDHERYFLLATLFPMAEPSDDRNLGTTLRRIRTDANAAGLDRRMTALLDADMVQLRFRLRQIVRLIDSQRVGVNWGQLLFDLLQWDRSERRVQKAWAMAYFGAQDSSVEAGDKSPGREG